MQPSGGAQAAGAGGGFVYEGAAGGGGGAGGGSSRASQAQLWRSTIDAALGTFQLYAESCVSAILASASLAPSHPSTTGAAGNWRRRGGGGNGSASSSSSRYHTFPLPADLRPDEDADGLAEHMNHVHMLRYALLVLLHMLRRPTAPSAVVRLPLGSFLSWCFSGSAAQAQGGVLQMSSKYSVQLPGSDSALFVLQSTTLVSKVQKAVLVALARMVAACGEGAELEVLRSAQGSGSGGSNELECLMDLYAAVAEQQGSTGTGEGDLPATLLRAIALLVSHGRVGADGSVSGCALPLEPSSLVVRRLAQLSASNIARFLLGSTSSAQYEALLSDSVSSGSSRAKKRARTGAGAEVSFDTDTFFGQAGSAAPRPVAAQQAASVQASFDILAAVYPHLATHISGEHADLSTLSAALARASVEALLGSGTVMISTSAAERVTQSTLALGAVRLLRTVIQHSTASALSGVLAGLPALISISGAHAAPAAEAAVAHELALAADLLQTIVAPRIVPVPTWDIVVGDAEAALAVHGTGDEVSRQEEEMARKLDTRSMLQSGFLREASRDVLGVVPQSKAEAPSSSDAQEVAEEQAQEIHIPALPAQSSPRMPSSAPVLLSSPRNFSPDPVKLPRNSSTSSSSPRAAGQALLGKRAFTPDHTEKLHVNNGSNTLPGSSLAEAPSSDDVAPALGGKAAQEADRTFAAAAAAASSASAAVKSRTAGEEEDSDSDIPRSTTAPTRMTRRRALATMTISWICRTSEQGLVRELKH